MADRWIITGYTFVTHSSLAFARKELARLQAKCPNKTFTLMRVKTAVEPSLDKAALGAEVVRLRNGLAECRAILGALDVWVQAGLDTVTLPKTGEAILKDIRSVINATAELMPGDRRGVAPDKQAAE